MNNLYIEVWAKGGSIGVGSSEPWPTLSASLPALASFSRAIWKIQKQVLLEE